MFDVENGEKSQTCFVEPIKSKTAREEKDSIKLFFLATLMNSHEVYELTITGLQRSCTLVYVCGSPYRCTDWQTNTKR